MIDTLWHLTTFGLLPHPYGAYVMGFGLWIGGAWTVIWWARNSRHRERGLSLWFYAAIWPAVLATALALCALTSPMWIPAKTYDLFLNGSSGDA